VPALVVLQTKMEEFMGLQVVWEVWQ